MEIISRRRCSLSMLISRRSHTTTPQVVEIQQTVEVILNNKLRPGTRKQLPSALQGIEMILESTMASNPVRKTLSALLPGGDHLLACQEHHHHHIDESSECSSDTGSSTETRGGSKSHSVLQTEEALGMVHRAVRIFGGVIIGAAAQEISRTFGMRQPKALVQSTDEFEGDIESDRGEESFASFDIPASSPLQQKVFEDLQSRGGVEGISNADRDNGSGLLSKRPASGFKRKLSATQDGLGASPDRPIGDATPRAPGGRAAARAMAAGNGCTSFVSECILPTDKGEFRLRAYRYHASDKSHEPVVMVAGDIRGRENVPVRVHDQCQTSEVLGSKRCDCKEQLDLSLRYIQKNGGGAVIYLAQEGRGIGLANKIAAYALQDDGLDTVDANRRLGFKDDQRSYECVDFILRDMGVKSVQLMTNNPFKLEWLRATGVKVAGRIPVQVPSNKHNHGYLEAKAARMSHLINNTL